MLVVQKYVAPKHSPFARLLTGAEVPIFDPMPWVNESMGNLLVGRSAARRLVTGFKKRLEEKDGELNRQRLKLERHEQELIQQQQDLNQQDQKLKRLEQKLKRQEQKLKRQDEKLNGEAPKSAGPEVPGLAEFNLVEGHHSAQARCNDP